MLRGREISFIICVIFCMNGKTLSKELGFIHDDDDDWTRMKWDSILDPRSVQKSNSLSSDDPDNLDSLFTLENEPSENLKSKEKELERFPEDEVFLAEIKNIHKESAKKVIKNASINQINLENSSDGENENKVSQDPHTSETKSTFSESNPKLDSSQSLISNNQEANHAGQPAEMDFTDSRSFIFNPGAKPEEQFENCTTPRNESGNCRYLQHCMIPSIVGSLGQFMDYVCIIQGRFIGVCCPTFPVSIIVIQEEEQAQKGNTTVDNNLNEDQNDTSALESNRTQECGISTNTRIVGGSNADPKAWPWMVALFSKSKKKFFCGGSLINDRYVLTAAHCTFGVANNEIIARVGEYDFEDDGESHDDYAVIEIKRHGQYSQRTLRNDIALLKLERPVVFNEFIKTICFPEEENEYVGETATLAGWGNIKGDGKTSDVLQEANLPVISNANCSKGHGLDIPESLICTGAEAKDKGACNGDSGGPLMLLDKNNRWKVIGLVSWGRRGCSPEFPTVYTRVSHFMEWIKMHSS